MSEFAVFVVGAIIFAITVYGTVVAGGLSLTRRELEQDDRLRRKVDDEQPESGLPVDVEY